MKGWPLMEGDNLVVFYYLTASEIWPDKRGGLWLEVTLQDGYYTISVYRVNQHKNMVLS